MDSIPDYTKFKTVDDLVKEYGNTDGNKHPERLEAIIDEIERRKGSDEPTKKVSGNKIINKTFDKVSSFVLFIVIVLGLIFIFLLFYFGSSFFISFINELM